MNDKQREIIRGGYLVGATETEMAAKAGVPVQEVETYLSWWCDRGCPPGGDDSIREGVGNA